MTTGKLALVGAFVLAFFAIVWWFGPGIGRLVATGTPKQIFLEAAFPVIAAFFFLFMAVKIALSKESGPYREEE